MDTPAQSTPASNRSRGNRGSRTSRSTRGGRRGRGGRHAETQKLESNSQPNSNLYDQKIPLQPDSTMNKSPESKAKVRGRGRGSRQGRGRAQNSRGGTTHDLNGSHEVISQTTKVKKTEDPLSARGRGRGRGRSRWGRKKMETDASIVDVHEKPEEAQFAESKMQEHASMSPEGAVDVHSVPVAFEIEKISCAREFQTLCRISIPSRRRTKPGVPLPKPAQPVDPVPRVPSAFERLAAELRWKIYEEFFTPRRVEVNRVKEPWPAEGRRGYKLSHQQLHPRNMKTGLAPTTGRLKRNPLPMSLIFTCKSIYRETILQLYWTTQFVFNTTRTIARFLRTTSKDAQASIRHLELNHTMYNEPRLTEFRTYKTKSDMAFYMVCDAMAARFTSLEYLRIDMTIWDWPIRLAIGEPWSWPLLLFGESGGIQSVHVNLRMCMFEPEELKTVAVDVEKRLMDRKSWQVREDERLARKLAGQVKTKVLKVVI